MREQNPQEFIQSAGLLAEFVAIQDGAVVSRTLLNRPTGTITLFAFDQGQGLSEHTAPFDAFLYVVLGSVEITISGRSQIAEEGEALILPAGEPHALRAQAPMKMLLVMIRS
jgi:quercetin dioxygenase-like cupin family protein